MTNEEAAAILESEAEYLYSQDEPYSRQAFNMAIEALQERKTGKWIDDANDYWDRKAGKHEYKCKECGHLARYFIAGLEDWWCSFAPNYCPYCGAKMEVSVNENGIQ